MARWFIRKPTFSKVLGAYRSQAWRSLMRLIFPWYGKKGMGWWRNPRKAAYNWWYNRTSVSLFPRSSKRSPLFSFCMTLLAVFTAPAGGKSSSTRSGRKTSATKRADSTSASAGTTSRTTSAGSAERISAPAEKKTTRKKTGSTSVSTKTTSKTTSAASAAPISAPAEKKTAPAAKSVPQPTQKKKIPSIAPTQTRTPIYQSTPPSPPVIPAREAPAVPRSAPDPADETAPRSTPRSSSDRYIRKRLLIAGTYFADQTAVNQLAVGSHLDLTAEPDNPHDPNAVALYHQGRKVGYIARQDALSYAMCLRLKRPVYGVVTDIRTENGRTVYEYETWFADH